MTVLENVAKYHGADRLGMAYRAMEPPPTTAAVPFTPGFHRSRTSGAAG